MDINDLRVELEIGQNTLELLTGQVTDLNETSKHFAHILTQFKSTVNGFQEQIDNLDTRLKALEEKRAKAAHTEYNANVALAEEKQKFLDTFPTESDPDNWPDTWFTLWYSYLRAMHYKKFPDALNSYVEVAKRTKKGIRKILDYYRQVALNSKLAEDVIDIFAKRRTKQFIEYMLLAVEIPGQTCPLFWQVCSEWALTTYGDKLSTWQKLEKLEDKPLD